METRLLKELCKAAIYMLAFVIAIIFIAVPLLFVVFISCIIAMLVIAFCKFFKIQLPFYKFINIVTEEIINEDQSSVSCDESTEEQYPYVEDIYEDY